MIITPHNTPHVPPDRARAVPLRAANDLTEQQIARAKSQYVKGRITLDRFEEVVELSLQGYEVDLGDWSDVLVRLGTGDTVRLRQWYG